MAHTAIEWIQILLLGGLAGAIGQSTRVAVGIKKFRDSAAAGTASPFRWSRLYGSVLIGATAGAIAAISTDLSVENVSFEELLGLMAAGYAGADFIEGFSSKLKPKTESPEGQGETSGSDKHYLG